MRLQGLGTTTLTPTQILQTAINAGFDPATATQMVAIAMRESGGNPNATAIVSTAQAAPGAQAEQSYGLWQINILGNPTLMAQLGITSPSQLLDPATNAQAAFLLYNNNPANLNTAWYINQPGYSQAYQANLPAAESAAQTVLGYDPLSDNSDTTTAVGTGTAVGTTLNTGTPMDESTGGDDGTGVVDSILAGNIDLTDPTTLAVLVLGAGALFFVLQRR